MCHAHDAHRLRLAPDVFKRHGHAEQHKKRNALEQSDSPQAADGGGDEIHKRNGKKTSTNSLPGSTPIPPKKLSRVTLV